LYALFSQWGYHGFEQHSEFVGTVYRRKRDLFSAAMKKHLTGLAEWNVPVAGMFLWFKLILPPCYGSAEGDSEDVVVTRALDKLVLALPGTSFYADGRKSAYVRASFSGLPEEMFEEATKRLAEIVKATWAEHNSKLE